MLWGYMDKVLGFLKDFLPTIAYFPVAAQCLFSGTLFLAVISAVTFTANYKVAKAAQDGISDDKSLPTLVRAAAEHNRKYILESVTMIVQPERSYYDPKAVETNVNVRIVYTVYAREDMKLGDFPEEFRSKYGTVAWLAGSETEHWRDETSSDKKWDVDVVLKRGERQTIITSAQYHYPLPLPAVRETHGVQVGLNQEAWCYDNDDDVIGQVTIMVESGYPLEAPRPTEDVRLESPADANTKVEGKIVLNHNEKQENYSLVGTWRNVMPRQNTIMRVRYQPTAGTRFEITALRPAA